MRGVYKIFLALALGSIGCSANAQFIVSDPGVESAVGLAVGELGYITANTSASATSLAEIATMFSVPTASAAGITATLDGGGTKEAASDPIQFMPELNGTTPASPAAGTLIAQDDAAILADEAAGAALGDPFTKHYLRDQFIGSSFQGDAFDKTTTFAARYGLVDSLVARLIAANIKDAVVLSGIATVAGVQQAILNGQVQAQMLAAIGELIKHDQKEYAQYKADHEMTATLFAAAVVGGAAGAAGGAAAGAM